MRHLVDAIIALPLWVWAAAAALAPIVVFFVWLDAFFIHPNAPDQSLPSQDGRS